MSKSDLDTFIELLKEDLYQRYQVCEDYAATPCEILRAIANSIDAAYTTLQEQRPKINLVISPLPPSMLRQYLCTVCGKVPVDAENGYDTCESCLNKI